MRAAGHVAAAAALCLLALAASPATAADERGGTAGESGDQRFVDALRREDPASAERYVALRDARARAMAELRQAEAQYNGAGPELRRVFFRQLRQAQRRYAETSLAVLDFLDARDRRLVTAYQEEIGRINAAIDDRRRTRAEFERLLRDQ